MLELYHSENCPYCVKVRVFLEEQGIPYVSKAFPLGRNSALRDELIRIGGKGQVPFLVDPDKSVKMYESDDIIAYVKTL